MGIRDFLHWAWNPPVGRMITDHPFKPLDWDTRCGYLSHPQANRCFQPRRYHASSEDGTSGTKQNEGDQ